MTQPELDEQRLLRITTSLAELERAVRFIRVRWFLFGWCSALFGAVILRAVL